MSSDEPDLEGFTAVEDVAYASEEVESVVEELSRSFDELQSSLQKANILLVGKTGVGKSSLVNAVFGGDFAKTGTGEPVTTHLSRYAPAHKRVVVFDTKGLEHGNHEAFVEETTAFLSDLRRNEDLREHLHVVWYVIDMSHARFQPFEERICREILCDIPLFFVLNKVDTAEGAQVASIRACVEQQHFPSCRGVHEVVCDRQNYAPSCCPACGSEDIRIRHKRHQILCDNEGVCGAVTVMGKTAGLDALVSATIEQLPHFARHSFVNAQEVSEVSRILSAKGVIVEAAKTVSMKRSGEKLIEMTTRLALLWNYRFFPSLVTQDIAHHFYEAYQGKGVLQRIALVLKDVIRSHRMSAALVVAIGVEVCRILCELKMQAVGYAMMANKEKQRPVFDQEAFGIRVSDEYVGELQKQMKQEEVEDVVSQCLRRKLVILRHEKAEEKVTLSSSSYYSTPRPSGSPRSIYSSAAPSSPSSSSSSAPMSASSSSTHSSTPADADLHPSLHASPVHSSASVPVGSNVAPASHSSSSGCDS